ncbi:MAG: DUF523 domain-containing protein [Clostridia bacterium]|nr:DUF523 domain-containing protein [Clostridia bacterium]
MTYLVSACLLGENCKYNGGNNLNERVLAYVAGHRVIPVCPEMLSGLGAPRKPVELRGDRVVSADGDDFTDAFHAGVARALAQLDGVCIDAAILQSRSPTCGTKQIYDGTFTRTLQPGMGLLARALDELGIPLIDAADL